MILGIFQLKEFIADFHNIPEPVCHIFGAGDFNLESITIKENDFVIAADGGFLHCQNNKIIPNLLIGDFDSLKYLPNDIDIKKFPIKKDDTDIMLAVKEGLFKKYNFFVIYGGLGGNRISHSLANIAILAYLLENNAQGFLVNKFTQITAIKEGFLSFSNHYRGYVSVFSLGNDCDVSINGLEYNGDNINLTSNIPLGVSNEFCGNEGEIRVNKGTAVIILEDYP